MNKLRAEAIAKGFIVPAKPKPTAAELRARGFWAAANAMEGYTDGL